MIFFDDNRHNACMKCLSLLLLIKILYFSIILSIALFKYRLLISPVSSIAIFKNTINGPNSFSTLCNNVEDI